MTIQGLVNDRLEAIVDLDVVGPSRSLRLEVVIDTGFNGHLSLEAGVIHALRLKSVGMRKGRLADRTIAEFEAFLAKAIWHDKERQVSVVASAGGNLLAMRLLKGSRLAADVLKQGQVTIEPIAK